MITTLICGLLPSSIATPIPDSLHDAVVRANKPESFSSSSRGQMSCVAEPPELEGIRCLGSGSGVVVSFEQWQIVRNAFLSHDPKKIAPFISKNGILESSMFYTGSYRRPELVVHSRPRSKTLFLKDVSNTKIDDSNFTFSDNPSHVFAWFWHSLTPAKLSVGGKATFRPPTSTHTRSDVWVSKQNDGEGRLRFICEDGWLKVAEIKAFVSNDAGP